MQAGIKKFAKATAGDALEQHGRKQRNAGASWGGQQEGLSLFHLLSSTTQATAAAQRCTMQPTAQQQQQQQLEPEQHAAKRPRVLASGLAMNRRLPAPVEGCPPIPQSGRADVASYIAAIKLPPANKQQGQCKLTGTSARAVLQAAAISQCSMRPSEAHHTQRTTAAGLSSSLRSNTRLITDTLSHAASAQQPCRKQQQQQHWGAADPAQASAHGNAAPAASDMHSCPLCGIMLPQDQLQQHVDAELQELEDAEAEQQQQQHPGVSRQQQQQQQHWQQPSRAQQQQEQAGTQHANHWQQPSRQQAQQQQHQQQQQQWQEATPHPSWGQPGVQPAHSRQQPQWQQSGRGKQQTQECVHEQQHADAWQLMHKPAHRQRSTRQTQQRHGPAGSSKGGKPSRRTTSSSANSSSCVQGLRLAPSKQRGPDDAPVHVLGSFDHWGDSASNWMDDGMIGLEGAPQSTAECWEGIGNCAIGSRRLG